MKTLPLAFTLLGAAACSSAPPPDSAPAPRYTIPEASASAGAARRELGRKTEVLAQKIELFLPAALYGKEDLPLDCRPELHSKSEFQTAAGRRISIRPPEEATPLSRPARVNLGSWRLAAYGPIEILFTDPGPASGIVLKADGVRMLHREGSTQRDLPSIEIEGARVTP